MENCNNNKPGEAKLSSFSFYKTTVIIFYYFNELNIDFFFLQISVQDQLYWS